MSETENPAPRPLTPGPSVGNLLERLSAREAAAWQDFVQICGPVVYEWCRGLGLSASLAAQISERVFQSAAVDLASISQLEDNAGLRDWLWKKTSALLANQNGSPNAIPHDPPSIGPGVPLRLLRTLQFGFGERTWQAFWKVVIDRREPADVAAELGISADAVRVAKARVLRRIREDLALWAGTDHVAASSRRAP